MLLDISLDDPMRAYRYELILLVRSVTYSEISKDALKRNKLRIKELRDILNGEYE